MQPVNKLTELLRPLVADLGYEFVGLEYVAGRNALLRVYIDRPDAGVDLDDCEFVSGEIAALLDVEDPIRGHYNLEISSPGVARPLFTPEQFERFIGADVRIRLERMIDGRRKLKGRLLAVQQGEVEVEVDGEPRRYGFDDIAKANIVPDYRQLLSGGR